MGVIVGGVEIDGLACELQGPGERPTRRRTRLGGQTLIWGREEEAIWDDVLVVDGGLGLRRGGNDGVVGRGVEAIVVVRGWRGRLGRGGEAGLGEGGDCGEAGGDGGADEGVVGCDAVVGGAVVVVCEAVEGIRGGGIDYGYTGYRLGGRGRWGRCVGGGGAPPLG